MGHRLKTKHGVMPEVALAVPTGALHKGDLPASRAKGARWRPAGLYLEAKPHSQDKGKHGLFLSVEN